MTLSDILAITKPQTSIYVYVQNSNEEYELISTYDGKSSIDIELNNREVTSMYTNKDGLCIELASTQNRHFTE